MSTPRPSAAWLRIEIDAGSVTDLTKVRCSCGWKGRTRCGTRRRRTVKVPRLENEDERVEHNQRQPRTRHSRGQQDVHRILDRRREGLTRDDANEGASELNDVRLDAGLGRPQDEVSDTERGLLSLVVRTTSAIEQHCGVSTASRSAIHSEHAPSENTGKKDRHNRLDALWPRETGHLDTRSGGRFNRRPQRDDKVFKFVLGHRLDHSLKGKPGSLDDGLVPVGKRREELPDPVDAVLREVLLGNLAEGLAAREEVMRATRQQWHRAKGNRL